MKFNLVLILLTLFACSKSTEIPIPNAPIQAAQVLEAGEFDASCETLDLTINFESESYSLNGGELHPFSSKISGWIPDETSPTFYIISYEYRLCNFLELEIGQYVFNVEEIANPDGYWYEVTTTEAQFDQILNGQTVTGKFKKNNACQTRSFEFDLNSGMYTFGGPWLEFNNQFSATANFQPAEIRIYANNVAICDYLDLELADYAYTLESELTPHYRVVLSEENLVPLVNGESLGDGLSIEGRISRS